MNNNINRLNTNLAKQCEQIISKNEHNYFEKLLDILNKKQFNKVRISQDAINLCIANNVIIFDYFILQKDKLKQKYRNFFEENLINSCNPTNELLVLDLICTKDIKKIKNTLNEQCLEIVTRKEYETKNISEKINIVDLWFTPKDVINKFFEITKLNKDECFDPCASDGRWLDGKGYSIDILPMKKNVVKKDFLTMTKEELPEGIKTIVGNLPFSLLDEFVNKALELVDDCYFLVSGDTILKHFPNNIEHIYIFSGLEGNQRDNRSRCEFDVPFLIKSALWCCIVHITKNQQHGWVVESNIDNNTKRDGYHIALGKNTFIKSDVLVDENPRITKIPVKSSISWKGGKKLINSDGTIIDLKSSEKYFYILK